MRVIINIHPMRYISINDGVLINLNFNSVTITNKPPLTPGNAQYNSGSWVAFIVNNSPKRNISYTFTNKN